MIATALSLIAIGSLLSLLNWATLVASLRSKRFVSAVPLIGAIPLGCGLALLPETRAFAWLALIADYGTLALIIALPRLAHECWSISRFNLLQNFTGKSGERQITIKLFRRQIAVISAKFDPPALCNDYGVRVASFGMVGTWAPTESGFSISGYASDRQLLVSQENGVYTATELNYLADTEYKYDCLDGLVVQEQR
jgi:hypothetical protein